MLFGSLQFISIALAALVAGMFVGPWLALTRTIDRLEPVAFVPVLNQLSPNMARSMTLLLPLTLLSLMPLLLLTVAQGMQFYAYLLTFVLFSIALIVTIVIEVPLVKRMEGWTVGAMPAGWADVRDRWMSFHLVRVACGLLGLWTLIAMAVAY